MGVPIPLSECMLLNKEDRCGYKINGNYIYNTLMRTWIEYKVLLVTSQSIVSSFLFHPDFRTANRYADFSGWRAGHVDKSYDICPRGKILPKQVVS